MLHWVIPCKIIQVMSPLPHGLFKKFLPVLGIIKNENPENISLLIQAVQILWHF